MKNPNYPTTLWHVKCYVIKSFVKNLNTMHRLKHFYKITINTYKIYIIPPHKKYKSVYN